VKAHCTTEKADDGASVFPPLERSAARSAAATSDKAAADTAAVEKEAAERSAEAEAELVAEWVEAEAVAVEAEAVAVEAEAMAAAEEKEAAEKEAAEKEAADKGAADKVAANKGAADKVAALAASQAAEAAVVAEEKEAAEKEAAEKVAADKVAAHKVAADKVAADKGAAGKVAADKGAAGKVAAGKVAAGKVAAAGRGKRAAVVNLPTQAFVGPFIVGMKVNARFKGGSEAFDGEVVALRRGGSTADIRYVDGDFEKDVPTEWITAAPVTAATAPKKRRASQNSWNQFQQWARAEVMARFPAPVAQPTLRGRGRGARDVPPEMKKWREQVHLHSYMYAHMHPGSRAPPCNAPRLSC
jgi:hypothetical protein